jgi:hypothetical protein
MINMEYRTNIPDNVMRERERTTEPENITIKEK